MSHVRVKSNKQTHTPKWNIALTRGGRYRAAFKQEVAIEALKGTKTIQQIASDYTLSSDVVKGWKKQAREMMEEGFKRKGKKKTKEAELEAKIGHLEILLGQREFELDWLTKKSKELGL